MRPWSSAVSPRFTTAPTTARPPCWRPAPTIAPTPPDCFAITRRTRSRPRWPTRRCTASPCANSSPYDRICAVMTTDRASLIPALTNIATQLRIDSARATTAAGSGHPTSCFSMAEIMAALFFSEMRFEPKNPQNPDADRFILSKGHAAPILYAAWAAAGAFDRSELLKLRQLGSDLEGHPTPRLPFVDVATGSLGQGVCAAIGCALNAR